MLLRANTAASIRHIGCFSQKEINDALARLRKIGVIQPGPPEFVDLDYCPGSIPPIPEKMYRVWIELTLRCNLKCPHCYAESSPEYSCEHTLSTDQWKSILDHILDFGCTFLTFIGGEPLLEKEKLFKLIDYIRVINPEQEIGVFSNLVSLPKDSDSVDYFKYMKVGFGTSIHGSTAEQHDRFTGRRGSFSTTVTNIRRLRHAGIPVFVGVTPLKNDEMEKRRIKELLISLDIDDYNISLPAKVGRGCSFASPLKKESKNTPPKKVNFSQHNMIVGNQYHNCFYDHIAIDPRGNIMPCIMMREKVVNLTKNTLPDYFRSGQYKFLSGLSKKKVEGCRDCEFRYACFDCRVAIQAETGDYYAKPICGYDPRHPLGVPVTSAPLIL